MDTRPLSLRDEIADALLQRRDPGVHPADLSVYEGTAVRPSTSEAAAAIRADRAARKAANFAKRNPGRTGQVFAGLLVLLVFVCAIFAAVAVVKNVRDDAAIEPVKATPDNKFISLDTGAHRSVSILIDPKSGHRWLIMGESGTAMIQLQPEEFPE